MRHALTVAIALFVFGIGPAVAADPPKPNVVLFLADDLGWADCSPYGGKEVPTPNMARLAADGVTLTQAFVASPSCAPSRAALLTGLDPMRNGAMLNHARPKTDVKKWPAYFKDLGYEVVAIGKVAHYAQVTEYGFDHASHFKYHEDDCVEAAVKWLEARKPGKPLCLLAGTNWPHVPWPKETKLDPAKLSLPPTLVDTKETRQARARYLAAVANADRDLGLKNFGRFESAFHRDVMQRAAKAITGASASAQPATHYGWGVAVVKEVAPNRRILGPDGKVRAARYTATKDPALRAEPEGIIDPEVSVLSFWNGDKPVAVLSYYACHPRATTAQAYRVPTSPGSRDSFAVRQFPKPCTSTSTAPVGTSSRASTTMATRRTAWCSPSGSPTG